MTAREKQTEIIKSYLKPTLKRLGYQNSGQTWWKDKGDFFVVIKLQNFSWNSKGAVSFCFNTGLLLKATLSDKDKTNPTRSVLAVHLREGFCLPDNRQEHSHRNSTGYQLNESTDSLDFTKELKTDMELHVLPYLEKLNSIRDCLDSFGELTFWGENLKRLIRDNNLRVV